MTWSGTAASGVRFRPEAAEDDKLAFEGAVWRNCGSFRGALFIGGAGALLLGGGRENFESIGGPMGDPRIRSGDMEDAEEGIGSLDSFRGGGRMEVSLMLPRFHASGAREP